MKPFYVVVLSSLLGAGFAQGQSDESLSGIAESHRLPYGVIDPELAAIGYAGTERFRYDISYTGGLKLGELHLEIDRLGDGAERYVIRSRATTRNGLFERIYPIEDLHVTKVSGAQRLPYHYEVWQQEGYDYEAHRVTTYDQRTGTIRYRHNDNPAEIFTVDGQTQNEFSAFFASRLMNFAPGSSFIVPTFADKERVEVVVMVKQQQLLEETIFGPVNTIQVEPIMTFRGLYDKQGDTVIWYTNDQCRVPVLINSKILIGSLTATLVHYQNPACRRYDGAVAEDLEE